MAAADGSASVPACPRWTRVESIGVAGVGSVYGAGQASLNVEHHMKVGDDVDVPARKRRVTQAGLNIEQGDEILGHLGMPVLQPPLDGCPVLPVGHHDSTLATKICAARLRRAFTRLVRTDSGVMISSLAISDGV